MSESAMTETTHAVLLRHTLPKDDFKKSTHAAPANGSAADAKTAMAEYYPVAKWCTLAKLKSQGPASCTT
jgi:hypothetical protein